MMKRMLSFTLAMAMFCACFNFNAILAAAETSDAAAVTDTAAVTSASNGVSLTNDRYIADGITWYSLQAAIESGSFTLLGDSFYLVTAGNYYLAADYTLPYGLIIKDTVTLNLNDKILTIPNELAWAVSDDTVADSGIVVYGGNFTLMDRPVANASATARYWDTENKQIVTGTDASNGGTNTFTGGAITGGYNDRDVLGGGAVCVYSGTFTMDDGNLVGNATDRTGILGGAVYINANATFTMNAGSIVGNTSGGLAGAVYIQCKGTFVLNDGTIAYNSTGTNANYAGAVYNVGDFTMNGGLLDHNESMGGGAVSTVAGWASGSGVFTMNGGSITNNYAATAGGGVLVGSGGSFVMYGGSITGNSTGGAGGAINLLYENSTASIYNGSITGNTAIGVAGGIRVNGGTLNIGQASSSSAITIYDNKVGDAQNNVYLFTGSTITQVGTLTETNSKVGVTLQSGTGTAALSSTNPAYAITASGSKDDVAPYASDEGYYRILEGDSVILRLAGEIPGTDTEIAYSAEAYDVSQLFTYADGESFGMATYTITPITGEGKIGETVISGSAEIKVDSVTEAASFTVTQIGTFEITVQTSYTTTAEPKEGSAILTVTPSADISITWPTASDFVYGGNQEADSTLNTTNATVTIATVSGDSGSDDNGVPITGTFTWVAPSTEIQDVGSYIGNVIFTPNIDDKNYDSKYDDYFAAVTGEVTYNVTQRDVTIAALEALSRGPMKDVYSVMLNTASGTIGGVSIDDADGGMAANSGLLTGDAVTIDFSNYSATITDTTYYSSSNAAYYTNYQDGDTTTSTNYTGEGTFDVAVAGLTLTGADAANYKLVSIAPTTVLIQQDTPYVAWPTATNITYGQNQAEDSTLYGGKVYLQEADGTWSDITDTGSFVWVGPTDEEDDLVQAGTYTGTVQFVLNSTETAEYQEELEALTRAVDYLVEAAPVAFSVTNNSVAYGSYSTPTITVASSGGAPTPIVGTDYTVQYFQLVNGAYEYVTSPTEVGTYFIGVEFNSIGTDANGNLLYNYYHVGTSVSTAKQIGVLVIYEYEANYNSAGELVVTESVPQGYDLSFTGFAAVDPTCYDVADALPQTIHILPTLDTDTYLGWETEQSVFYDFGSRFPQPEYDVTLTAVLVADNNTISGNVTGYELGAESAEITSLSKVAVVLMSGNDQIATAETDENGNYSFSVMPGRYTVEFTLDYGDTKYIESVFADATSGDATVDMYFPQERYTIELNLASGMDGITVDGLQDILNELSSNKTVENGVAFNINQADITSGEYSKIMLAAAEDGLTTDNVKLFYDVQITQALTDKDTDAILAATDVASVDTLFAIYIPLSGIYQAKESYTVYRDNGATTTSTDLLTTTPNGAGEYIKLTDDGKTLVIYAKQSALYAISFVEPAASILAGLDATKPYGSTAIDVSTLGMFDLTGLGTATYTITPVTGEGSVSGNSVTVSKVGAFTVTVTTAATATANAMQGTATLTVTPKEVAVANLVGVARGPVEDNYYVALDASETGTMVGVINNDDVFINTASYQDAYGRIEDKTYTDYTVHETDYADGTATFGIAAGGLTLDGDDKANYVLNDMSGTVEIKVDTPYIAWPTAPDINYHDGLGDSTLYGGKVIVLDTATGNYVQLAGTFEWLDEDKWVDAEGNATTPTSTAGTVADSTTVATTDIGTYTQYVKFVEDTTASNAPTNTSYRAMLEGTVHAVEVTIKATSVSFTVADNDVEYDGNAHTVEVTANASSGKAVTQGAAGAAADGSDTGDYIIQYYQFAADNSIVYVTAPTEVGAYFVAAYFTNSNYHHAGTLEYTGKQIGVLYIREAESEATPTYRITFESAGSWSGYTLSGIYAEDIHNLPTITNADGSTSTDYIGWSYNGSVYDFGARLGQPATNITLAPVAAPASYAVAGTVYGEDLDGTKDTTLSNIAVAVMQGSETVATLETGADGTFSVDLPEGYYTIVITRDQVVYNEVSVHVQVSNKAVQLGDIVLPDTAQNTVLEIASGVSVASVDGIDDVLAYYLAQDAALPSPISNTIKVDIDNIDIVNAEKTEYDAIMAKASEASITADYLKLFFDVTVWRTYGSDAPVQINTIPGSDLLEIYITLPGTYQGDYTYQVYRYHTYDDGSKVDVLTTTENAYGEKIELMADGQTLKLTAQFYSVYGVAYLPITTSETVQPSITTPSAGSTGEGAYYTVTYALNGGKGVLPGVGSYQEGTVVEVKANTVLRDGYIFAGWLCSADGRVYQVGDVFYMTGYDVTLTAQWVSTTVPTSPPTGERGLCYTLGNWWNMLFR